jgi:type I restriction enzyme S subunit
MERIIEKIKMAKYLAYKNSGVEWLGEIPSHWTIKRIKHLFTEINERSFDGSEDLLSVSQYTGVTNKTERLEGGGMLTNASTLEGYKKVWEGDLVSNIMLAWNGSLGFSPFNGITSPAYSIYRLKTNDVNRYFHYLLRTELYKSEFKRHSSGVIESRLRLYTDDFFRIESILPPLPEQTAIAAFLDRKTALIDQAIDIKQKQIELLKERKQILIHKAVTRGLNPNVKMKDSGVEWIGEIPEGWEVKRLKYLLDEYNVRSIDGKEELLSLSKYFGVVPKSSLEERAGQAESLIGYKKLNPDDLVINKMQAVNGLIAVSKISGITSPDYSIYHSKNNKILNINYLGMLILQPNYLAEFKRRVTGVMEGFIRLYTDDLYDVYSCLPPINEQNDIMEFINNIKKKIANAISLKEQEIEKLKEYKATLINSAVTGKIKVTNDAK